MLRSLHDTQLKMVRKYVFSSSDFILSCLQDSSSSTKPSQRAHLPSLGYLNLPSQARRSSCSSLPAQIAGLVLVGGVLTLVFVLGGAVLHGEVKELKKSSDATKEALVRTQRQYEELKKKQQERAISSLRQSCSSTTLVPLRSPDHM